MLKFQLLDDQDVQQAFAAHLRGLREHATAFVGYGKAPTVK
jgi:hypothetical protein